jgi:hypothetical protein
VKEIESDQNKNLTVSEPTSNVAEEESTEAGPFTYKNIYSENGKKCAEKRFGFLKKLDKKKRMREISLKVWEKKRQELDEMEQATSQPEIEFNTSDVVIKSEPVESWENIMNEGSNENSLLTNRMSEETNDLSEKQEKEHNVTVETYDMGVSIKVTAYTGWAKKVAFYFLGSGNLFV